MRSLVLLAAISLGFVAGYFYYPELVSKYSLEGRRAPVASNQQEKGTTVDLTPPPPPPPEVEEKPEERPQGNSIETPLPPPPPALPPKPDETVFHPPVYPTVEEFTVNWTKIPASAFPREVVISQPVTFVSPFGKAQFKGGSKVVALGLESGKLALAPSVESRARAAVEMASTNLQSDLKKSYNMWVERRVNQARNAFESSKKAKDQVENFGQSTSKVMAPAGEAAPRANPDGSYPVVLQSLGSKVTEITTANIKKWKKAELIDVNGDRYWSVVVTYLARTPFGEFETEGQALIKDNAVQKWIYTGSKEEIP